MRIVVTASSLELGGSERATSHLANGWAERGDEVSVVTLLDDRSKPPFFSVAPSVRLIRMDLRSVSRWPWDTVRENRRRAQRLRRVILAEAPDVVVAMTVEINIRTMLALWGTRIPVIMTERTDPRFYRTLRRRWRVMRQLLYPVADALVVQTEAVRRIWPPWIRRKTWVIPNVVPLAEPSRERPVASSNPDRDVLRIVAAGRLSHEKGFDLLLKALAPLATDYPGWQLEIYGEGPARRELESQVEDLSLARHVGLPGAVKDLPSQMVGADVFVLPSRLEGFPNALCEAMALGIPVCAMDCPSGPAEIITPESNGLLVPAEDIQALRDALRALLFDAELRQRIGAAGRRAAERFRPAAVLGLWDRCFNDVLTVC